jgi:hypothetical protein
MAGSADAGGDFNDWDPTATLLRKKGSLQRHGRPDA